MTYGGVFEKGMFVSIDKFLNFIDLFMEGVYSNDIPTFKEVFPEMQEELSMT